MNIIITGSSRGIGLELTNQALEAGDHVLAVARRPSESRGLESLQEKFPKSLELLAADVADPEAPAKIEAAVEAWPAVDILVNNAGVYPEGYTREDFNRGFQVNSVAPFLITKALLPKLKKSKAPRAIQITSQMGSIEDCSSGGSFAYRASKAALNMLNKCLAIDSPWLVTIVMHPGWVKTDMGGEGAPVLKPQSAEGIWKVARKLKDGDSGKFYNFKGETLPW